MSSARPYGTAVVSFNFEPQTASPIDARLVVSTFADLTGATTFKSIDNVNYAYAGMMVSVANDGDNNGLYRLNALPTTVADNWKRIGEGEAPTSLPVKSLLKEIELTAITWSYDYETNTYKNRYTDADLTTSFYTIAYVSNESRNLASQVEFKNVATLSTGSIVFEAKALPSNVIKLTLVALETTSTFSKVECVNTTNYITASSNNILYNKNINTANGNTIAGLSTTNFTDGVIVTDITTGQTSDLTIPTSNAVKEYVDESIDNVTVELNALQEEVEGKQDTLTFDDTPTSGSNNPVKSSGIHQALSLKANTSDLNGLLSADNLVAGENIVIEELTGGNVKISSTGGLTEVDATHVTYSNPTYPTVAAALDKLLYVALTASMSGGGTYELGTSIATVNLTWSYNKSSITSQSINQGIGTITDLTQRSYSVTGPFTSGKTWTLTASDGTTTKTASTSLSFLPKRYWGVSASTSLTNEQILALSNELSTSRSQSRTFDCSGGKYFYFVIRQDYCSGIKFTVGGLAYTGYTVTSQTVTNALGYSATYNVYRSGNIQTGSAIPVVVS